MSAYTSTQTGNWSAQSTWGGTGPPGNGDTATVATGHTVTVDGATTVGSSPADRTTMVLTVSGTGKLVIASGVTLTVNGNAYFNSGSSGSIANSLEMNADSQYVIGSNAVTNGWVIQGGKFAKFYIRGTSGHNAVITAAASGFGALTLVDNSNGCSWDAQYLTVSKMGNSSTIGWRMDVTTANTSGGISIILDNVTVDSFGGQFFIFATSSTATQDQTISITSCTFTNFASISNPVQVYFNGSRTGNTMAIKRSLFDSTAGVLLSSAWGGTVGGSWADANYLGAAISVTASGSWPDKRLKVFSNNFVRVPTTGFHVDCSQDSNYWLVDTDGANNGAIFAQAYGGSLTLTNGVIDQTVNVVSGSDQISLYSDGLMATITGAANNGSGLIRITTSSAHGYNTGDQVAIAQVAGTTEANNASASNAVWTITVIDSTHFDLQGSTFTHTYTSGGYSARYLTSLAVTGAANNGSGKIRITTATHSFCDGDSVTISGVGGTTEANGTWTITVASTTTFDLNSSTFTNAYTSGGTVTRQATSTLLKGWVHTPSAYGATVGKFLSQWGVHPFANCSVEHNTYISSLQVSGPDPSSPEAGVGTGESAVGGPLEIVSLKSNLVWCPPTSGAPAGMFNDANAHPGVVMLRWSSNVQDYAAAANCDYNWGYNLQTENSLYGYLRANGYRTTAMFSSGSPDAHGCTALTDWRADPQFVDATRVLAKYDTSKLGNSYSTWLTSTSYSVGDFVQLSQSGIYAGATIGYRCIVAHTSGTSTKPQSGASWRTNWEFSSLYRLRQDMTRIQDAWTWVREGAKVKNATLRNAGHDGATVGACDWQSSGSLVPIILGTQRAA